MIANIGSASYNHEETLNTLRYSSRAKQIQNQPRMNKDPKDALLIEEERRLSEEGRRCLLADLERERKVGEDQNGVQPKGQK